ncbi:hypothetical protein V1478_000636 [Vespula squamosa]|uniref:Uncharacterized protein n=1 Tax=Vespula squamosa TaxID=30214 RepID=A0ABD2C647_VESSQ
MQIKWSFDRVDEVSSLENTHSTWLCQEKRMEISFFFAGNVSWGQEWYESRGLVSGRDGPGDSIEIYRYIACKRVGTRQTTSYRLTIIIPWDYVSLASSSLDLSRWINWVNDRLIPPTENPGIGTVDTLHEILVSFLRESGATPPPSPGSSSPLTTIAGDSITKLWENFFDFRANVSRAIPAGEDTVDSLARRPGSYASFNCGYSNLMGKLLSPLNNLGDPYAHLNVGLGPSQIEIKIPQWMDLCVAKLSQEFHRPYELLRDSYVYKT